MTAYAIIETGGKQLRVEPGRFYDIELLPVEPEAQVTIEKVLFVRNDDTVSIGQPFVAGASIQATVLRHLRGRKIIVYKMRPKKKTRKKQGHRQELTRLMIDAIHINGTVIGEAAAEVVETAAAIAPEVVPDVPEVVETAAAIAPEVVQPRSPQRS